MPGLSERGTLVEAELNSAATHLSNITASQVHRVRGKFLPPRPDFFRAGSVVLRPNKSAASTPAMRSAERDQVRV